MDVEDRIESGPADGPARDLQGVYRYYELAKRAEWQVKDLPWGELPPTPEYRGSPQKLARMTLDAETLEEKVFLMQVFFERLIIPRFRLIARSSRGTVLEDLCNRLAVDDGIHHGAGMAYERVLLKSAGKQVRTRLVDAANTMLPVFAKHVLWRPKAREVIGTLMEARDRERLREELNHGVRLANSLGLDVSDVRLPAG